jgi:hypothetical protein
VVNINEVLDGHVALDAACVDRLCLNGYVANMQVGAQVNQFCRHLGQSIIRRALTTVDRVTRDYITNTWPPKLVTRTNLQAPKKIYASPETSSGPGAPSGQSKVGPSWLRA